MVHKPAEHKAAQRDADGPDEAHCDGSEAVHLVRLIRVAADSPVSGEYVETVHAFFVPRGEGVRFTLQKRGGRQN